MRTWIRIPSYYAKLGAFADAVGTVTQSLPDSASDLKTSAANWVTNFKALASNLKKMADDQVTGTPHSADLLAFIHDAVKWTEQPMCGGVTWVRLNDQQWETDISSSFPDPDWVQPLLAE